MNQRKSFTRRLRRASLSSNNSPPRRESKSPLKKSPVKFKTSDADENSLKWLDDYEQVDVVPIKRKGSFERVLAGIKSKRGRWAASFVMILIIVVGFTRNVTLQDAFERHDRMDGRNADARMSVLRGNPLPLDVQQCIKEMKESLAGTSSEKENRCVFTCAAADYAACSCSSGGKSGCLSQKDKTGDLICAWREGGKDDEGACVGCDAFNADAEGCNLQPNCVFSVSEQTCNAASPALTVPKFDIYCNKCNPYF